jgi:hypothetical protein
MELPLIDFVTLAPVPESQRQIITNLIQLYKYDFSEFAEIGTRYGEERAGLFYRATATSQRPDQRSNKTLAARDPTVFSKNKNEGCLHQSIP